MTTETEAYIYEKRWDIFKREGGGEEIILAICPLCGEKSTAQKRRFYINAESGLWHTHCCDRGGNLFVLRREMGDLSLSSSSMSELYNSAYEMKTMDIAKNALKSATKKNGKDKSSAVIDSTTVDEMHTALLKNKKVLIEVKKRGFKLEIIKRFKLGYAISRTWKCDNCGEYTSVRSVDPKQPVKCGGKTPKKGQCKKKMKKKKHIFETHFLAIPIFDGSKVANIKFRSLFDTDKKSRRFERIIGAETTLFNVNALKYKWKTAYITEAELDAISLEQYGFSPTVGLTSGAAAGPKLIEKYREKFVDFDLIYLCLDMDEAGEKAANEIADVLGAYRCVRVKLPLHDANDCLMDGITVQKLSATMQKAKPYGKQPVFHVRDLRHLLGSSFKPAIQTGLSTGIPEIDILLAGLQPGQITVVTGETGSGKSTLCTRIAYNSAVRHKAILSCSFEMSLQEILRKLLAMAGDKPASEMTPSERNDAFDILEKFPIYMYDSDGPMAWSKLQPIVEYCVRRHGLKLLVLDHFEMFLEQGPYSDVEKAKQTIMGLWTFGKKTGIHTLLVAHPAKLRVDRKGNNIPPDLNDLKGATVIKQYAHNVTRTERPRDPDRKQGIVAKAVFTALKVRHDDGREGSVDLRFKQDSLGYRAWTVSDNIELKNKKKIQRDLKKKAGGGEGSGYKKREEEKESIFEEIEKKEKQTEKDEGDLPW